jgi:proline-specific peptidase
MTDVAPVTEGYVPFRDFRTWYRIVGDLTAPGKLPLLAIHGGPGIPSDSLEPLAALATLGRPVVFYDQVGCGNSEQPVVPSLWSIGFFLEELAAVRAGLDLNSIHLLGFSWGGALAIEYALTQPSGLAGLVLHNALASSRAVAAIEQRTYDELPAPVRETLRRHEAAGTTDDPAYEEARRVFDLRFICRIDPWPDYLQRAVARASWAAEEAMADRQDRHAPGGRATWDMTPHLGEIGVPTLVLGGRHDGLTGGQEEVLAAGIPGAEMIRFEESSHYPHAEEPERFRSVVDGFLTRVEQARQPH